MGDLIYPYQKKRRDFGKYYQFEDSEIKIVGKVEPDQEYTDKYVPRNPNTVVLDNIPAMSEHYVNTERVVTVNRGMKHIEGGWPKEIDPSEAADTNKWRKRMDKDPTFSASIKELCNTTYNYIQQNNQIDIFEEYFLGESVDHSTETLSTKTLMLFKDQNNIKRSVSKIAWHPDGPQQLAVAYSILRFQQMPDKMPYESYIWDVNNPNVPVKTLATNSPLVTLSYNAKNSDFLVGGSYNGVITFYDVRKGGPDGKIGMTNQSKIEHSHHDPVYDIFWLHSKQGTECVSCSTDGRILWWDVRNPEEPVETLLLTNGKEDEKVFGGTCLEYSTEVPMKYLVGTEQGYVLSATKKPKKSVEITHRYGMESGGHHGPIYACKRNPNNNKFFMTIGDWTAKVWMEDLKTPIMSTKYHASYLTDGCWSPTRPGVFYVTRSDGWLDVWDYYYRQNEVAFSHKVTDSPLSSIALPVPPSNQYYKLAAIGDSDGTVTLMELCDALCANAPASEKTAVNNMFEREQKREKNLEQQKKQAEAKKGGRRETTEATGQDDKLKAELQKIEAEFFKATGGKESSVNTSKVEESKDDKKDDGQQQQQAQKPQEQTQQQQGGDQNAQK